MATHAPIMGAQTRAPGIDRRKLFAGIGAFTLMPIAAVGAAVTRSDRPRAADWDRALEAYNSARHAADRYLRDVYRPMDAELDRIAPRPDLWFDVRARDGMSARFFLTIDELDAYSDHMSPVFRDKAAEVRTAWLRHVDGRRIVNHAAINDECDRLDQIVDNAEHALLLEPAPDVAALWWKLDHLYGAGAGRTEKDDGDGWSADWVNGFMADANRLLAASAN